MAQNWKQAYSLAKFELKHSKLSFLLSFGILILLLTLVIPMIPKHFDESTIGLDFLFYFTFTLVFQLARPKVFKQQKLSGFYYASFHLTHLNQLPINREVIVRYRFLTYVIISLPFQLMFLSSLYFLSPVISHHLTLGGYFSFSIFWLCFSIYLGCGQLPSEAGSHYLQSIITTIIVGFPLIMIIILLFYKVYTGGFIHWTIVISNQYPVITSISSILLAIIGWNFWMKQMRRKLDTNDYL